MHENDTSMLDNGQATIGLQLSVLVLTLLLGLLANISILYIVYKKEILHTTTYYIICHLAVTDILSLLFDIPTALISLASDSLWLQQDYRTWCNLQGYVHFTTGVASIIFYSMISTDRFICLKNTFFYEGSKWVQYSKWMMGFMWVFSFLTGVYPWVNNNFVHNEGLLVCTALVTFKIRSPSYLSLLSLFVFVPCFLILVTTQVAMYRMAYMKVTPVISVSGSNPHGPKPFVKAIVPVTLTIVVFITTWLLYAIIIIVQKQLDQITTLHSLMSRIFGLIFITVPHLSNPFIYVIFDKKYCNCFLLVFFRTWVSHRHLDLVNLGRNGVRSSQPMTSFEQTTM